MFATVFRLSLVLLGGRCRSSGRSSCCRGSTHNLLFRPWERERNAGINSWPTAELATIRRSGNGQPANGKYWINFRTTNGDFPMDRFIVYHAGSQHWNTEIVKNSPKICGVSHYLSNLSPKGLHYDSKQTFHCQSTGSSNLQSVYEKYLILEQEPCVGCAGEWDKNWTNWGPQRICRWPRCPNGPSPFST